MALALLLACAAFAQEHKGYLVRYQCRILEGGKETWLSPMGYADLRLDKKLNIKIDAHNLIIQAQFVIMNTPDKGLTLFALGSVLFLEADSKFSMKNSLRAIPVTIGDTISFYPLGIEPEESQGSHIVLELAIYEKFPE
jgi:hypothetical protein